VRFSDAVGFKVPPFKNWCRALLCTLVCSTFIFSDLVLGEEMRPESPPAIFHELEKFRQMGSVLYIAAHPDDENTELLAYLARGRHYRTAYLSLTRGDGGQNVLGPDLGEKMGVARTQELLAARQIDSAQQFFSRAVDFGFSKSYSETLKIWNKQEVLSDIVRVIREFRPDVLITRFSPSPGGTHGHHTASAVLAMEAFKLAGDAKAFPEQGLPPWQPKRIFWNVSRFQLDKATDKNSLKIDIGGKDSVSAESFKDIAQRSRAMHKTQGFDTFRFPGSDNALRIESFELLDGAPATKDILDGIDTTWSRVSGGEEIGKSVDQIIAKFDLKNVSASVPALLTLREQLALLNKADPIVKEKRAELDNILQACLGLKVETTIASFHVVPGEAMTLHHSVVMHSTIPATIPVRWLAVRYPLIKKAVNKGIILHANESVVWDSTETLPINTPLTQPWWLRAEGTPGMFAVADPGLIGTAENAPTFPIENVFEVAGQRLVIADEPVSITTNLAGKKIRRRLEVIPPVWLHFIPEVALLAPGASRAIEVEITASRADSKGILRLEIPSNWKVSPLQHAFNLTKVGQHKQFKFTITAPSELATAKIFAYADINGVSYCNQRQEIDYSHIPPQLLQPPATLKVVTLELAKRGHTIGYIPGAGDSLVDSLHEMGYTLRMLGDANLTVDQLHGLDAVIVGVRALNVRKNMDTALPILFDYIKNGGTVIMQYNRVDNITASKIAPYDLHLSADRVTDEKAPITFLAPQNPLLNRPNKITSADFDNWVQERGLYFPDKWDEHFTPILACNDEGEKPHEGALLIAKYGKGYFIYTGLSFFRQLPAGVPGAYRVLANMISIDK